MQSSWLGLVILLGLGAVALAILSEVTRKSGKRRRGAEGEDVWSKRNAGPRAVDVDGPLPYRKREWILDSGSEASFYGVLEKACAEAVGRPIRVMVQVPVSRLIEVEKGLPQGESQVWRNKIDRKSVDYVVCEAGSLRPLFAVELDGSSHDRTDRKERDGFVERALEGAGVGLVRVKRGRTLSVEEVEQRVHESLIKRGLMQVSRRPAQTQVKSSPDSAVGGSGTSKVRAPSSPTRTSGKSTERSGQ